MIDKGKISEAIASIISAIGENSDREGLQNTPTRIADMYSELFSGINKDPSNCFKNAFQESHQDLVILSNIEFSSICEHHFLPFFGKAYISYIPQSKTAGASKFAECVDILSKRPQLQERLTAQIANTIYETINPKGVEVLLQATHMCISMRGINKMDAKFVTHAIRGDIPENTLFKEILASNQDVLH